LKPNGKEKMRITVTADLHVAHYFRPMEMVKAFKGYLEENKPDILLIAGDISQGANDGNNPAIKAVLTANPSTYFVMGNHDVWSGPHIKLDPPTAMERNLREHYGFGIPLERSWIDEETFYAVGDTAIVGSMGFPDFQHPHFKPLIRRLNMGGTKGDMSNMKIVPLGWLHYTYQINRAFRVRLEKAVNSGAKRILVVTHYSNFEGQCMVVNDEVSPYFFNQTAGRDILELARKNRGVTFWCVSGHSHEFARGDLKMEEENVYVYGCVGGYGKLHMYTFDTEAELNQEREGKMIYEGPTRY
jgi:predicted phosphohydrolase